MTNTSYDLCLKNGQAMIDNNLEWAYRIMQEPWRIKRQFFLPKFFFLLLLEVVKNFFSKGNLENK